jgi:hypothetical protein
MLLFAIWIIDIPVAECDINIRQAAFNSWNDISLLFSIYPATEYACIIFRLGVILVFRFLPHAAT